MLLIKTVSINKMGVDHSFISSYKKKCELIITILFSELVVCPNNNEAVLYEQGSGNWNVSATLKGVRFLPFFFFLEELLINMSHRHAYTCTTQQLF